MKKNVFILLIAPIHLVWGQQTITDSLIFEGTMRYYHTYIPQNYIKGSSRPLIIHLHGYGSNALLEQGYTNYMPIADTAGFLIVYPEGLIDGTARQYWNAGIPGLPKTPDDVSFLSKLIDTLHSRFNIDLKKVYASGLSNGGYMCYQLAWKLSNKIVAIASVSGSMAPLEFAKCKPVNAVPVMEIHGTADNVVPYTASISTTNIDTLLNFWVLNDGCIPLPGITNLPDIDPFDGTTVIHYEWTAELRNMACELYKIINGAHVDWPGAGIGNNGDFNASAAIWQFFNRFQLIPSSSVKSENDIRINFYPNPCSSILHITDVPTGFKIIDITGRTLIDSHEKDIDLSGLMTGTYYLRYAIDGMIYNEKIIKF